MADLVLTKGEKTRRNILQVALALFVRQGYHGTSMRQIAQQADLALSSLYNHFSSKEEVFKAVFLEYHPYKEVVPALLTTTGDSLEDLLRAILTHMISAMDKRTHFINLMFIEIVEFKSIHAAELLSSIFPQIMPAVQRIYQQHQDRLRSIPLPMFVRSYMGFFFSYYLTELIFAPTAQQEFRINAQEVLLDIYLHGVLARS